MKKLLSLFFIIGFVAFSLQSCTKTCTCVDPNSNIRELEVDPSENCSDRSSDFYGICS